MSASTGTAAAQFIENLINKLFVHLCVVLYFELSGREGFDKELKCLFSITLE